jgi:glycosyltransferase involved in cell wall biosynthesis
MDRWWRALTVEAAIMRRVRVAVVAEYYPRAADPVLGVWAHRQALAARDAGADVRVLVLHRPVPPLAAVRAGDAGAIKRALAQPRRLSLDGLDITYVRFHAPPRPWSYGGWGRFAARPLGRALHELRREFPFELVHAHYAVPAGDAVRRALPDAPLVISEHGGDVLHVVGRSARARRNVEDAFAHARLVLANSEGTARRAREHGAHEVTVVRLGTDVPPGVAAPPEDPLLVTVAHLVPRKRHQDVLRAFALLRERHPRLRWWVVGDGPERAALEALTRELGLEGAVEFHGQLDPAAARAAAHVGTAFVLPSEDEAFGVAYVEAMAGGVPAVGLAGEDGPEDLAALGSGIVLVPRRDPAGLAAAIEPLLTDPGRRAALGAQGREAVQRSLTWEACGRATVAAYEEALR